MLKIFKYETLILVLIFSMILLDVIYPAKVDNVSRLLPNINTLILFVSFIFTFFPKLKNGGSIFHSLDL